MSPEKKIKMAKNTKESGGSCAKNAIGMPTLVMIRSHFVFPTLSTQEAEVKRPMNNPIQNNEGSKLDNSLLYDR